MRAELLNAILGNVVGFDLNPLAVLTARVNYLLAIANLLEHRRGEVTIPVYLADSVRMHLPWGRNLDDTEGACEFPTSLSAISSSPPFCAPKSALTGSATSWMRAFGRKSALTLSSVALKGN
jgi:hypothetical protein